MKPPKNESFRIKILTVAVCLVYFTSYITRLNFSAVMVEIIASSALTLEQAGMVGTALFCTYGLGQLFSGVLGDKFPSFAIILIGVFVAAICNFCFPIATTPWLMTAIWALNGFAQSMLWPPLVRTLSERLSQKNYSKVCVLVTVAAHAATISIYLLVPLCLKVFSWKSVFFFSGGFAVAVVLLCVSLIPFFPKRQPRETLTQSEPLAPLVSPKNKSSLFKTLVSCGFLTILPAIAAQGLLRDGIITWMPVYLTEVFGFSTSQSILTNLLLPVLSIVGVTLSTLLYHKFFRNELKESVVLFGISGLLMAILLPLSSASSWLAVVVAALVTACTHGINFMLVCNLPARFRASGKVSTVSGITNAFTYIGSALASYGLAVLIQRFGWNTMIGCWAVTAVLGFLFCLLALSPFRNHLFSANR